MDRASIAKRRRLRRSHSRRSCYGTETCIDDLTNEVLIEIFLRLPAKTLHRFKTVSKSWLSLISSPYFARSYIRTHISDPSNNMIVFKVGKKLPRSGKVYTLQFHSNGAVTDVSSEVSNFQFIPELIPPLEPNRGLVDVYVKGTSGGLVLLQGRFENYYLDLNEPQPDDHYYYYYYHYVCNPVTKKWKKLPLISKSNLVGFTCYHGQEGECRIWLDGASYDTTFDPTKVEFTVVSIHGDEEDAVFKIKIFSSANEKVGWITYCVSFPRGYEWVRLSREFRVLFFFNGKFYWHGGDCIVAYDPFNSPERCAIIPLPPMDRFRFRYHVLGASEGCLRLASTSMRGTRSLLVWELLDYAKHVWVKKYEVNYSEDLIYMSFVGGGDKVYMVYMPSKIKILD